MCTACEFDFVSLPLQNVEFENTVKFGVFFASHSRRIDQDKVYWRRVHNRNCQLLT